jgi:two-component system response regulator YesN
MFKMLIADDERYVRDGLIMACDWEALGVGPILEAAGGNEAMALIEREAIDILISDIRMPGLDGLSLVKRVHEEHPHIKCFLLTGYAEFDYAYRAIQYGVTNFFLKPLDSDTISKAIAGAVQDLNAATGEHGQLRCRLFSECLEGACTLKQLDALTAGDTDLLGDNLRLLLVTPVACALSAQDLHLLESKLLSLPGCVLTCISSGKPLALIAGTSTEDLSSSLRGLRDEIFREARVDFHADLGKNGTLKDVLLAYRETKPVPAFKRILSARDSVVLKILCFAAENLADEELNLKTISRDVAYLSTDYIGKLFKKEMGMSFSEYLVKTRILAAMEFLRKDPAMHFTEVAQRVGYGGSPGYFSTLFRKVSGVSPTEYTLQLSGHDKKG